MKSGGLIELKSGGLAIPQRRVLLPVGDLRLADGRPLKHKGAGPAPGSQAWKTPNGLVVLASTDDTIKHGHLLHVSMSYSSRDPSWADIRLVRAAFYPADVDVMMVLPKAEDYVNVHDHCFHLYQTPTAWDVQ